MSKSKGNVVDPNDVVDVYGADVLRVYILFMGDYGSAAPWSESSVRGCKRFLDRVADLPRMAKGKGVTAKLESKLHKLIRKVSQDIEEMKFNTAIAAMMGFLNDIDDAGALTEDELSVFVRLVCPFAPHLAEEIWEQLGHTDLCSLAEWPVHDEAKTVDQEIEIAVQVNGKVRATVTLPLNCERDQALAIAKADAKILPLIDGKTVLKEIYVPNKILNIVVR